MNTKNIAVTEIRTALQAHGFRITNARVHLLLLLRSVGKPLSIQEILQHWDDAPNQATIYRTLSSLSEVGVIKRVATHGGTSAFEYTPNKPHHHHAVCIDCGTIEDIEHCFVEGIQNNVTKNLSMFSSLDSHSLEFFGHCNNCIT